MATDAMRVRLHLRLIRLFDMSAEGIPVEHLSLKADDGVQALRNAALSTIETPSPNGKSSGSHIPR